MAVKQARATGTGDRSGDPGVMRRWTARKERAMAGVTTAMAGDDAGSMTRVAAKEDDLAATGAVMADRRRQVATSRQGGEGSRASGR
ncbi:hypothetical protein E2562_011235 [Oryza meyeriana var. granulata]|uniref:DUF834 domain-containing protein n=1 Tax=Oryza meyeriana var. granulata TaxID=110450 RepID=A0A6G1DG75_9ORYZ|nr:hypothetical protein E2562_011235 [Oryza meyeriana var. granulata]